VHFYYIFCHTRGHPKPARNPRVRVRVQKCTRGSTCGRVFSNPAGLPTGGFSSNPHPHPRVPSLVVMHPSHEICILEQDPTNWRRRSARAGRATARTHFRDRREDHRRAQTGAHGAHGTGTQASSATRRRSTPPPRFRARTITQIWRVP